MYHSITFRDSNNTEVNTWEDWHLIPSERPSLASASVSTSFVSVPGRDGSIDMTDFLVNRPTYSDRSGSWDFFVDNDHEYWEDIRVKIMTFLHGKRMKVILEDDPDWYWEGRFTVGNWDSEPSYSKITINYIVGPYKHEINGSGQSL